MGAQALLVAGLEEQGMVTTLLQRQQLGDYLALIKKWNQAMNLTAIRTVPEMIGRHVLDSLSVLPFLHGMQIVDVGTGAGLPGIPLSILCPEKTFFLLDSNQKKQIFLSQVVKSLDLKNVQCIYSKVQTYQPAQKFSTILSRAFAPISRMIVLTAHLLDNDGRFLAMLGKAQKEPLHVQGYQIEQLVPLQVPGEIAQRHLAIIAKLTA